MTVTQAQQAFLDNMTLAQAKALLAKFNDCPETAERKSREAYWAFCQAWEMVHPGTYWQRQGLAGGPQYFLIDMRD